MSSVHRGGYIAERIADVLTVLGTDAGDGLDLRQAKFQLEQWLQAIQDCPPEELRRAEEGIEPEFYAMIETHAALKAAYVRGIIAVAQKGCHSALARFDTLAKERPLTADELARRRKTEEILRRWEAMACDDGSAGTGGDPDS